jgi:LmbE family N-acetylglucosaminyl deacetylase
LTDTDAAQGPPWLAGRRPLTLQELAIPSGLRVLVLAPHPDDFDAIGVTLRWFRDHAAAIELAVVTSGASGVEDSFCTPPTPVVKGAAREDEQRASCRFFGLPEACVSFLRLREDDEGHPIEDGPALGRIRERLEAARPDVVCLPHGNDTNAGHRRIYSLLHRAADGLAHPPLAWLNRDPKTIGMRADLCVPFGESEAAWKGELLRFHASQQQRNLRARGYGLDERILRVNRAIARELGLAAPYAEAFEIEPTVADHRTPGLG